MTILDEPLAVQHTDVITEYGRKSHTLPPLSRMVNDDRHLSTRRDLVVHSKFTQGDSSFSFFTARTSVPLQSVIHRICGCVEVDAEGNLDLLAEPCDLPYCSLVPWDEVEMGAMAPGAVKWCSPISQNALTFENELGGLFQEWDPLCYAILAQQVTWAFHRLVQTFGVRHTMDGNEWRAMLAKESRVLTR